jgi:hypothetical protein
VPITVTLTTTGLNLTINGTALSPQTLSEGAIYIGQPAP